MSDLDRAIGGLRCRDLLTLLADYVDGDLGAEEVGRVDSHLRACGACMKFGYEYGALVAELRRHATTATVFPDVRSRLAQRMERVWARESG